jgi:hypothetical protein
MLPSLVLYGPCLCFSFGMALDAISRGVGVFEHYTRAYDPVIHRIYERLGC